MTYRKASSPDWSPKPNCCHENVNHYVKLNPHCTAIRGWMIMSEDADGQCLYAAHSVVEDAGKLYDITLKDQAECDGIRFLRHPGQKEVFWAIERCHKQILYPCSTPNEQEETMSARSPNFNGDD